MSQDIKKEGDMLSVKGFGITGAIFCALWVGWSVLIAIMGVGNTPLDFFSQMYFGWLEPTTGGLILGIVLGFIDGLVGGMLFAWIYNAIAKK